MNWPTNGDGTTVDLRAVVVTVMAERPEAILFWVTAPSFIFASVTELDANFAALTAPVAIFDSITASVAIFAAVTALEAILVSCPTSDPRWFVLTYPLASALGSPNSTHVADVPL